MSITALVADKAGVVGTIVALLANLTEWLSHRQWQRALVGAFGLMGVLGTTHGFLATDVARGTFYAGLIVMILVAVWDLISPGSRRCRSGGDETQAQ